MTKQRTRHHSVRPWILAVGVVAVVALAGTWVGAQCCPGPSRAVRVAPSVDAASGSAAPTAASGRTVNSVCPMMGGKFDPNKIAPELVVAYKDGKVGFCCAMCIPKWNKLSDTEKDKKLAAALAGKK